VRHYVIHGWKEGRNPHPKFDTKYYLEANPDVKSAGTNPFWHYIVKGKAENRRPVPAGGYKRATLRSLKSIDERVKIWSRVQPEDIKTAEQISEGLNRALIAGSSALVVSLGHDDYKKVVGGVQLCIAEEQELLNSESINYLNISPAIPLPVLASVSPDCLAVKLILNGAFVGVVYFDVFLTVLKQLLAENEWNKYLVIHALLGHTIEGVIALAGMLSPELSYYWLHDYFSICPGYNLLRNGVDYCHAPESSSPACGICVYGEARSVHLTGLERLFTEVGFDVISPSRFALDLWEEKSSLPYRGKKVITHRELIPDSCRKGGVEVCLDRPLRVAYLGYPITHKGWPVFEDLAVIFSDDNRYDFYHLGIGQEYNESIDFVEVRTTGENLDLMTEVLKENEIDVVVLTSIWPETFSLTTFEAISAGCFVLTPVNSGNIAAMVQEKDCGMIYENEPALHAWFEDGSIVDHARSYRSGGLCFQLKKSGITAPLIPELSASE
jgi:glycosyltransferase involved in cell wall biosynthesis